MSEFTSSIVIFFHSMEQTILHHDHPDRIVILFHLPPPQVHKLFISPSHTTVPLRLSVALFIIFSISAKHIKVCRT